MITTLVMYIVLNGEMKVEKFNTANMADCQELASMLITRKDYVHVECKVKKITKKKEA